MGRIVLYGPAMVPANERANDGNAMLRPCILRFRYDLGRNQSANKGVSHEQGKRFI